MIMLFYADPTERLTLEAVAAHTWVIGDYGPIPQYLCWCKRKRLQEESQGNKDDSSTTHTDKIV